MRCHYDAPRTSLERLQACPEAEAPAVTRLLRLREQLDPFALSATIDRELERLVALATPARAPVHPRPAAGRNLDVFKGEQISRRDPCI